PAPGGPVAAQEQYPDIQGWRLLRTQYLTTQLTSATVVCVLKYTQFKGGRNEHSRTDTKSTSDRRVERRPGPLARRFRRRVPRRHLSRQLLADRGDARSRRERGGDAARIRPARERPGPGRES